MAWICKVYIRKHLVWRNEQNLRFFFLLKYLPQHCKFSESSTESDECFISRDLWDKLELLNQIKAVLRWPVSQWHISVLFGDGGAWSVSSFSVAFFTCSGGGCSAFTLCTRLVASLPFPCVFFLIWWKTPPILAEVIPSPAMLSLTQYHFCPAHLHSWMSRYRKAWSGCEEGPTCQCDPGAWWFGFQMPFSECLLGDRKLSAADQGLSDNRLSALTAHTDLELIK